jgi:hypothetical protein
MPKPPAISRNTPVGADVDLDRDDVRLRDGTRLTRTMAQAINTEVRRAAGMPSLTGAAQRSPQVSTRIPPEQMRQLKKYSKAAGMSVSSVLREALDTFMKNHTGTRL